MDRPLWQIVLAILLLSFAVQRAGAAAIGWGGGLPPMLAAATAVEAAAAAFAAIALWLGGRRLATTGVIVLGVAMAANAALLVYAFGAPAAPAAASRILVAAVGAAGLSWVFSRELGPGGRDRRDPPEAAAHPPRRDPERSPR